MTNTKDLAQKIDKITFALFLLTNSLRANIKLEEGEVMASIPVKVLDSIENLLKNL